MILYRWLRKKLKLDHDKFIYRNDFWHALIFFEDWGKEKVIRHLDVDEWEKPIWELLGTTYDGIYGPRSDPSMECNSVDDARKKYGERIAPKTK